MLLPWLVALVQQQHSATFLSYSKSGRCRAVLRYVLCRQTFQAAKAHPAASMLQLQACILGGDDLAASLGATRTVDNSELAHARGMFLLTCRALQVCCGHEWCVRVREMLLLSPEAACFQGL